ncbi:MAG: hypothetical protein HY078_12305 [Elusimicrobia bacterium]|nr:hypothetical protein [Elusimicrobiota bacterium]
MAPLLQLLSVCLALSPIHHAAAQVAEVARPVAPRAATAIPSNALSGLGLSLTSPAGSLAAPGLDLTATSAGLAAGGSVSAPASLGFSPAAGLQSRSLSASQPIRAVSHAPSHGLASAIGSPRRLSSGDEVLAPAGGRVADTAIASARSLSSAMSPKGAPSGSLEASGAASRFYDRSNRIAGEFDGRDHASADAVDAIAIETARAPFQKSPPRVVMILDTFDGKAPEQVSTYVNQLLDKGSKVVFVTPRPYKGDESANSVLTGSIKARTTNPLMVVSYNGGMITPHTPVRSADHTPKPLVPNLDSFAENTVTLFRQINATAKSRLGVSGDLQEFGYPDESNPMIYGAMLPAGVDAEKWAAEYNGLLQAAGHKYKIEMGRVHGTDQYFFIIQLTSLELNTQRIFQALFNLHPRLNPTNEPTMGLKAEEVWVLGDPTSARGFLNTMNEKELMASGHMVAGSSGFHVKGVTNWAEMAEGLGSLLGHSRYKQIKVNRFDIRDYLDWLARKARFGSSWSLRRLIGQKQKETIVPFSTTVAKFKGVVIKHVVDQMFHYIRAGEFQKAKLEKAIELLEKAWKNPAAYGIRVSPDIEAAMLTDAWKAMTKDRKGGTLDVGRAWLRNFYGRLMPRFEDDIDQFVGSIVSLRRDGKQSAELHHIVPETNEDYIVYALPDMAQVVYEPGYGWTIIAHVFRTGREPTSTEFDEGVEPFLVGRAALKQWADERADGQWYVNDQANPHVRVVFHYETRYIPKEFTVAQLESTIPNITSIISRRQTDAEYQQYVKEKLEKEEALKLAALKKLEKAKKKKK